LQQAGVTALSWGPEYYAKLAAEYDARRRHILETLDGVGLRCFRPKGAYYVMVDISSLGRGSDVAFVRYLIETLGIAAVPGSSFYALPENGREFVRFCFCKKCETLEEARRHFSKLQAHRDNRR
jgi:aspartate/methionine/tyrosine aminotransferase